MKKGYGLGLLLLLTHVQAQENTIATIDLNRVIQLCNSGQQLRKALDDFFAASKTRIAALEEKIKATEQEMRAEKTTTEQRAALARVGQEHLLALKRLREDVLSEGKNMEKDGLAVIEGELLPLLENFTSEKGIALMLDRSSPLLLYAADHLDITEEVILRYNQAKSQAAPPPAN